jgi:ABC-type sugar transport system ATPase subunit
MVDVELRGVTKSFGATQVLQRIDATIASGSFAVLVGPSGCGKSTLLRLLAGLEEPSSGTIHFGDRDVTHLAPRDRDLAMVFQSYALYPHMTVRENLAFGLRLRKESPATIAERVQEAADILGLDALLDRHPRALSGGQRQRVAMGRAIVRRAKVFLFDEPLSNLDQALRAQVRVDIRKLHDRLGATSVYVTHDQVEAMTLADQLFVLDRGVVQQQGAPLDVYEQPGNTFVARFVGSPAMNLLAAEVRASDGVWSLRLDDATHVRIADPEAFPGLAPGQRVLAGIRPHDVVIAADGELAVAVDLVETMGPEAHVHATVAGKPAVFCLPGARPVALRDALRLAVTRLHLFDADTGRTRSRPLDASPAAHGDRARATSGQVSAKS